MSKPSETWSNLTQSDETTRKQDGPSAWDRVARTLSSVGDFAGGFVADQIHAAGQDVVSRVLLGESYSPTEAGKDRDTDAEKDRDRDRDKDEGLDR